MTESSRRRLLAITAGVVTTAGAGCLDESSAESDEPSEDDADTADGDDSDDSDDSSALADATVDYPAFVDDDVRVMDDGRGIEYSDSGPAFVLAAKFEGADAAADELRVSRDLDSNVPTAYIAPVVDGDSVTYHVFANESFVDFSDWALVEIVDDTPADERRASFDDLQAGVVHLETSTDADGLVVVDGGRNALETDAATLVGIHRLDADTETEAVPQVAFSIERLDDGTTVEITHTSGDHLEGDAVVVDVDGDRIENPFGVETVTAGDTATLEDVPVGAELAVRYDDGETAAVMTTTTLE
ncbi:hypothetical protein [Natronorubrum thiooxidans]|uniref:Uncharacterized protein n=1 Tax=Natronorubrum thiooxidans TaxID=308853 RepID=A0A1N7FAY1_9EURY|nr:hypothetical protein [Natronorubrum thiooxidans]SIR97385.1 hypothetical protein SAMN05421752_106139 [Natronorubrum thiooxidans]